MRRGRTLEFYILNLKWIILGCYRHDFGKFLHFLYKKLDFDKKREKI